MVRLNLSISDELNNSLTWAAESLDRSKGYIVRKAIENYLQEIQEDMKVTEFMVKEEKVSMVKEMLKESLSVESIMKITKLPKEQIEKLKQF